MADPIATMAWSECLVPRAALPADLAAMMRRERGAVPTWALRIAPLPWLVRGLGEMTAMPIAYLPTPMYAVIALVVSRDSSCRFCYGAQRALMRVLGYEVDAIDRLERDELVETDPSRQLALEFARRVSRGGVRSAAADRAALERAGFSSDTVAEVVFAAASTIFANRVSTLVALPPDPLEGPAHQLVGRLLRPLIRRQLRRRRHTPTPPPTPNQGVGAAVVAALGTSPAAGVVRRVIDAALASPVLPRRTKLLMLAVIARALGCVVGEQDATAALRSEGMAPDDVAETLTHLGSASLDAREARLVPFARETVRCQPRDIQLRTRELSAALGLGVPELLEVIGVVALGNTLSRASVIVDPC
jgi:alkylhydroperoxidase family enzyme